MANDEAALKEKDGNLHNAISTRKEANWSSNVFGAPTQEKSGRRNLEKAGAGRGGLYGDSDDPGLRAKKVSLAGTLSTKEPPKPVVFDEAAAEERKMKELYGNA